LEVGDGAVATLVISLVQAVRDVDEAIVMLQNATLMALSAPAGIGDRLSSSEALCKLARDACDAALQKRAKRYLST
jgi:hypothetical protein